MPGGQSHAQIRHLASLETVVSQPVNQYTLQ